MPSPVAQFDRILTHQQVVAKNAFLRQAVEPFEVAPTHTSAGLHLDGDILSDQEIDFVAVHSAVVDYPDNTQCRRTRSALRPTVRQASGGACDG